MSERRYGRNKAPVSGGLTYAVIDFVRADADSAARALTSSADAPRPTFPLVLASVTVAVLAMHVDAVGKYSADAFWLGVTATAALAWGVGRAVSALRGRVRTAAAVLLPSAAGALVGLFVQLLVLDAVVTQHLDPVRDLGGVVDTTDAASWIAGGAVLGAAPALAVSLFLLASARAMRRLAGHDAEEDFSVGFVGLAAIAAAIGLVVVDAYEAAPLAIVVGAALVSLVVAILVDGARLRFLRQAWRGADGAFQIVSASAFAGDASLAPIVGAAGARYVLMKADRRPDYRGAAARAIALVGETEALATAPLVRRRFAAAAMLVAAAALATIAALAHAAGA